MRISEKITNYFYWDYYNKYTNKQCLNVNIMVIVNLNFKKTDEQEM